MVVARSAKICYHNKLRLSLSSYFKIKTVIYDAKVCQLLVTGLH